MPPSPAKTAAVIGAGPSGLVTARTLLLAGFNVVVYERNAGPGGVWLYDSRVPDKPSVDVGSASACSESPRVQSSYPGPCYDSLMTNVKTPLMKFSSLDYPPNTPWFVPHSTILEYLRTYAQQSCVQATIRYRQNVVNIERCHKQGWSVTTESSSESSLKPTTQTEHFTHVAICTGHFDAPYIPLIPGLTSWRTAWPDRVSHSKSYRGAAQFKNKSILIIGGGSSAYDLTRDIACVATSVHQSSRMDPSPGPWTRVIGSIVPQNVHSVPEVVRFSEPDSPDIRDAQVVFSDNSMLSGVDAVILCTGYRFHFPFLAPGLRSGLSMSAAGRTLHGLALDIFHPETASLAFVGVPFPTFPFLELHAETIAAVWFERVELPNCETLGPLPDWRAGVEGEVDYVRATQGWWREGDGERWAGGGRGGVEEYARALREAERVMPKALGKWLKETCRFEGVDDEEKEQLIEEKIREFEALVAAQRVLVVDKA